MPFGQEPKCGHETAMFSGRTIYVIAPLQIETMHWVPAYAGMTARRSFLAKAGLQEPYRPFKPLSVAAKG